MLKYKFEIDDTLKDDEIIIKCNSKNEVILKDLNPLIKVSNFQIQCFIDDKEYYLSSDEILFFETEASRINAHTKTKIYKVKYKLYELQEILADNFVRISKSSIVNINHIYSIKKNITSFSIIEFANSYKTVCVSRMYFKNLDNKLKQIKNINY